MVAIVLIQLAVVALLTCNADAKSDFDIMQEDIQAIVDARALSWNCSFSVAVKCPALGVSLRFASKDITTESKFAWGSITKMWTGANIMQLVARGVLRLDEPFTPFVDAQFAEMKKIGFPGMTFSRASDLWGPDVEKVTIRNLIHMQSGIPDFDTANPSRAGHDVDPFRATVYRNPLKEFLLPDLMSVPWVATHNLTSTPGSGFQYSSTNFELLGLIIAHLGGIADYRNFNQSSFIPASLSEVVNTITWAQRGSPEENGVVVGFDRTDYNGQDPKKTGGVNVVGVHGVFSGWAASDFVAPPSAVAELGYALWGNSSALVPAEYRDMMVPTDREFYGFASQNVGMMGITGGTGDFKTAYGHLGATYGYDSIFGYSPRLDLGIAVATNIETLTQTQPSDAYCGVYNRVKNYLLKEPVQTCIYETRSYYGGECKCKATTDSLFV